MVLLVWLVVAVVTVFISSADCGVDAFAVAINNHTNWVAVPQLTADFGPARNYYVPGRLRVVPGDEEAQLLCKPFDLKEEDDEENDERLQRAKRKYSGMILLVMRGQCSFLNKTYNAVQSGALGLVISNTDNSFIRMGPDGKTYPHMTQVPIPVVNIELAAYTVLVEYITTDGHLPMVLDTTAEQNGWDDGMFGDMNFIGNILLMLPVAWMLFLVAAACKRRLQQRREQEQRTARTVELPIVKYDSTRRGDTGNNTFQTVGGDEKKSSSVASSTSSSSVPRADHELIDDLHNDACAICLDDFEWGMDVRLLPCRHGFHPDCIDPWLNDRSDLCPICKQSILDGPGFDLPSGNRWSCAACCPSLFNRTPRNDQYNPLLVQSEAPSDMNDGYNPPLSQDDHPA